MSVTFPNDSEQVKQVLMDELQNLLSCEKARMNSAEERMKQLECTEGYGVYLAETVMNQSFELPLRQIACIMLTRYVEKNWHEYDEDGNRNDERGIVVATESAKRAIRNILPNGLYDPHSKIRNSVAHTISTIASLEDPSAWTDLFDIVIKCLSGNEDSIQGATLVLKEFTYDVNLIKEKGHTLVMGIHRVFIATESYTVKTRVGALHILRTLFSSISALIIDKLEQASMVHSILECFMKDFLIYFRTDNREISSLLMRTEIAKFFTFVATEMPKFLNSYMLDIMPTVWQVLTHAANFYVELTVNHTMENPFPAGDDDDDSDYLQFHNMISQVLEFVNCVVTCKKLRSHIEPVLEDLIYITIVYIEMTVEQIDLWQTNPDKFIEEEDEVGFELTVRMCSKDLLLAIADEFSVDALKKLEGALRRHFDVAKQEMNNDNVNWWKIHEACMVAVHIFREIILENSDQFDLLYYLTIVHSSLSHEKAPLLVGRALWTLSTYSRSELYNPQLLGEILDKTLANLWYEQPLLLRISAVRAVDGFLQAHESTEGEKRELILSKLGEFYESITHSMHNCKDSSKSSVMSLLIEALTAILKFSDSLAQRSGSHVVPIIIDVFLKYPDDPFILESVQDLITALCKHKECLQTLHEKFIPIIVEVLTLDGEQTNAAKQDIALDVLTILVKRSEPPLPSQVIEKAFPAVINLMKCTDDHSVMVAGSECLRAFIHVTPEQIVNFQQGGALASIMEVTTMLLNPMQNEMTAGQVGRLVITIITKIGKSLGSDIDLLLKAVISKMQLVKSLKVIMSLIVIFAHLFLTQMEAAINFLTTIPDPTGEPAIKYLFANWLTRQSSFFGAYERRVTTIALCKILELGITKSDQRLYKLTFYELCDVPTEAISEGVRRRSQAPAQEWMEVPLLVKILRALISELFHLKETKAAAVDYDSDEEEESNADKPGSAAKPRYVSDIFFDDEDEQSEDDEMLKELMQDPEFQNYQDMEQSLSKFVEWLAAHPLFPHFYHYLSASERETWHLITGSSKEAAYTEIN